MAGPLFMAGNPSFVDFDPLYSKFAPFSGVILEAVTTPTFSLASIEHGHLLCSILW